jgi:hypothetical protein
VFTFLDKGFRKDVFSTVRSRSDFPAMKSCLQRSLSFFNTLSLLQSPSLLVYQAICVYPST